MPTPTSNESRDLAITALGVATSLGTDPAVAFAAARAGMMRPNRLEPFLVRDPATGELEPVTGHPVGRLSHGFIAGARLARLGALALTRMIADAAVDAGAMNETGLVLVVGSGYLLDAAYALDESDAGEPFSDTAPAMSEENEARRADMEQALVSQLFKQVSLPLPAARHLLFEDQAGVALALHRAGALIQTGTVRRCLVGAIDSFCDARLLEALQGLDLLKAPTKPDGLTPGEAAGFIMLESPSATGDVRAIVHGASVSFTPAGVHQFAPNVSICTALHDTIARCYGGAQPGSVWTIGTHNGTSWAAGEWGRAVARLPRQIGAGAQWYPATSFGDTGAATGVLAACMATRAFERGYAPARTMLNWGSSPRGSKGAFCLSAGLPHRGGRTGG